MTITTKSLFPLLALVPLLTVVRTAEAATVVVNVSNVAGLYQAFSTADGDPSNLYEIRLAAGTYRLLCAVSGDTQTGSGSLKLTRGTVRLIGAGDDLNGASGFVIDGGWTGGGGCASFFKLTGPGPNPPSYPTLDVRGLYLLNGSSSAALAPIELTYAVLGLHSSRVRHTRAQDNGTTGGGAIYAFNALVSISRSYLEDGSTSDGARGGVCGSGFFGWGGSVYFSNSGTSTRPAPILSISQSTIRTSKGCRGGAVAYNSGSSAQLVIRNSTIEENVAPIMGGGLYLRGPGSVFLSGNTIAQNTAANGDADPGAAIAKVGGGIAFDGFTGPLTMKGNIIAKNKATAPELANGTPAPGALDCQIVGTFSSNRTSSFDLLGMQGNCAFVPLGPLVGTTFAPVDPRLGTLSTVPMVWPGALAMFNGLQPGSPAIIGNGGTCEPNDQRGAARNATACDLGSFQTACLHDPCKAGNNLVADCGACVASICSVDSYCCTNLWDPICVNEVFSVCGLSCPQ